MEFYTSPLSENRIEIYYAANNKIYCEYINIDYAFLKEFVLLFSKCISDGINKNYTKFVQKVEKTDFDENLSDNDKWTLVKPATDSNIDSNIDFNIYTIECDIEDACYCFFKGLGINL